MHPDRSGLFSRASGTGGFSKSGPVPFQKEFDDLEAYLDVDKATIDHVDGSKEGMDGGMSGVDRTSRSSGT